jgi:3-oxoacyl-[acyl-carrier protein] reductase
MSKLTGKVALVTGSSKGIGAAIAKAVAAAGASVVVNYSSDKEGAEKVVAAITQAGGKAVALKGDVSKESDAQGLVNGAVQTFGGLDVVVNNSGVYEFTPLEAVTEVSFHRQFNTNVLGTLLVTKAALPHLKAGASIVNVSSVVSTATPPMSAVYSGTKGAVDAITGVLSKELGSRGIRVNSVNPGVIETEGTTTQEIVGSDFEKMVVATTPLGRIGQPQEVADVVVFLASDDSRWVTGEHVRIAGGLR